MTHFGDVDVNLDNLLFCNSVCDDLMQRYLEKNPTKIEGNAQIDGENYPIFNSQPFPNKFTWDTSAYQAELMSIYLMNFSHGPWSILCLFIPLLTFLTAQRIGQQATPDCSDRFSPRVLETILQSGFGPAVDIWAVGCIVR